MSDVPYWLRHLRQEMPVLMGKERPDPRNFVSRLYWHAAEYWGAAIAYEKGAPMLQVFKATNDSDEKGNPDGGTVDGKGLQIVWQKGPLGRDKDRIEPNGAFVETVIAAAMQRLQYYQLSKFKCDENQSAIEHLGNALKWLERRTKDREKRAVEGTHGV